MSILPVLLKKELIQFWRNKFLPVLIAVFPALVMLLMPWTTQMDIKNVSLTVVDQDCSSFSRRVQSHLRASQYFVYQDGYADYTAASIAMDDNKVDVLVSIPADFERNMLLANGQPILVEANGVNAMKGQLGLQYVMQTVAATMSEMQRENGAGMPLDRVVLQNRYNPTGNAFNYMIPALMIIVILLVCGFLPALNIVTEKETGTIEMINVTPVTKYEFTFAKLIPYWVFTLFIFSESMLLAWWVYDLTPVGSISTIFIGVVLFSIVMSAFGVTLANISDTLQQTVFLMFFFLLNFMLLSGLLTPISSMPDVVQYIAYLFPPRYLISIMRAVYLKGTTFFELWPDFAALLGQSVVLVFLAVRTYKKQS